MKWGALLLCCPAFAGSLLIRNATVYDGTGKAPFAADVRIEGDRIAGIGKLTARAGERVVDARRRAIAPGFIDIHNHSERGLESEPSAKSQVAQGITTLAVGPDGGGPWPIGAYLEQRRKQGIAVNVAAFAGHATIRHNVMGPDTARKATDTEIAAMAKQVDEAMWQGAFGLSSGLEYDTGFPSTTEELIALAKVASWHGGTYMTHMRDESDRMLEALAEALRIGKEGGLPVQISHIKMGTVAVWGKAGEAIALVDKARAAGQDVTADWYPYDAWSSTITVLVPSRQHDNREAVERGLADVGGPQNVTITSCDGHPDYVGSTLAELAARLQMNAAAVYSQIVKDGGAGVVCHAMTAPDMSRFWKTPWVMAGSDGGIGSRHPRGAGTFPRLLRNRELPLEETIRKMTSAPARRLGLPDRGELRAGWKADLVLFDPVEVRDEATFREPVKIATGIDLVLVNGVAVWEDGKVSGELPGTVLLHSQQHAYERLRRLAGTDWKAATEEMASLRSPRMRDTVEREAFLAACVRDRAYAASVLPRYQGREWLGQVGLLDAIALGSREVVLASVRRNPAPAIRQTEAYARLPFAAEVLAEAARAAPDEAVRAAIGQARLRELLLGSDQADVRVLGELAGLKADPAVLARAAVLHRQIGRDEAVRIAAGNSTFFARVVDARLAASGREAIALDRFLESFSLRLCRLYQEAPAYSEVASFSLRDLFLLLAYGRAEQDDQFFGVMFDRLLAPKLRATGVERVLTETRGVNFRLFAEEALAYNRFDAFLRLAKDPEALLARTVASLEQSDRPMEEAVVAAEILAKRSSLRARVEQELERVRASNSASGEAIYSALLDERDRLPSTLDLEQLFHGGVSVERQFFYNDSDGVESYGVFRKTYGADPRWTAEEHRGWVLMRRVVNGRRVELYSNVPVDLTIAANAKREAEAAAGLDAITRELNDRGVQPVIVIHRGHSYHVDKTIPYINSSARLVFLGSCRGLGKLDEVVENAPEADVIATKAVGSHRVNDPLLKSLNDELLRGSPSLEWPAFWNAQQARLGGTGLFADYIPPHRNATLAFLRGYLARLDAH